MKSYVLALAALAAIGFAGTAFAGGNHSGKASTPAAMTDPELDNITAAGNPAPFTGFGVAPGTNFGTASIASDGQALTALKGLNHAIDNTNRLPPTSPGSGICTAGRPGCP